MTTVCVFTSAVAVVNETVTGLFVARGIRSVAAIFIETPVTCPPRAPEATPALARSDPCEHPQQWTSDEPTVAPVRGYDPV